MLYVISISLNIACFPYWCVSVKAVLYLQMDTVRIINALVELENFETLIGYLVTCSLHLQCILLFYSYLTPCSVILVTLA
jgi:hypothetical protein